MRLPSSAGMLPLNWLYSSKSVCRLARSPASANPVAILLNSLWSSTKSSRAARLPNSAGMLPLNRLLANLRCRRLDRLPNAAGMLPLNRLFSNLRSCRSVMLPNSPRDGPAQFVERQVESIQDREVAQCSLGCSRSTRCLGRSRSK